MSWDIQKLVMESEGILDPAEKYILIYIAINVNENEGNVAWCTQGFLAEKTGYHVSTVKRPRKYSFFIKAITSTFNG